MFLFCSIFTSRWIRSTSSCEAIDSIRRGASSEACVVRGVSYYINMRLDLYIYLDLYPDLEMKPEDKLGQEGVLVSEVVALQLVIYKNNLDKVALSPLLLLAQMLALMLKPSPLFWINKKGWNNSKWKVLALRPQTCYVLYSSGESLWALRITLVTRYYRTWQPWAIC